MQTTIPMFSKSITKYKWKKRSSPVSNLKQLMQLPSRDTSSPEGHLRANTSYDNLLKGPLYQSQFDTVQEDEPQAVKLQTSQSLFKIRKTSIPTIQTDDQQLLASNGKPLMKQKLNAFLNGGRLPETKARHLPLNNKSDGSKRLLLSTSCGKLGGLKPDLGMSLQSSPKWMQVREKHTRYPHIC